MRPQSYIGVTGFMNRQQVYDVCSALPGNCEQLVMIGVLVSNRTLRGAQNRHPNRYPKPEQLGSIFASDRTALNLLHFNTDDPETLLEDLCLAQDLAGPNCDGFQLNIAWPDKNVLRAYKTQTMFQNKTVVLQCGRYALDLAEGRPSELAAQLREYEELIDYILIDPSGGTGQAFDPKLMLQYVHAVAPALPELGIGVAGGLSGSTLNTQLIPTLTNYDISWDAEGRLRDAEDNLDVAAAQTYLRESYQLRKRYWF